METLQVVSPSEWLTARKALLQKEKEFTKAKDALAAEHTKLPVTVVTKDYSFDIIDPTGKEKTFSFADLFEGKSQLIVYHFMFKPDWEEGCSGCTFLVDHLPYLDHLKSRETNMVLVSRAEPAKLAAYKARMGWDRFHWYSSQNSDFNYDFHVTLDKDKVPVLYNYRTEQEWKDRGENLDFHGGEQPGMSVFAKDKNGQIYHAYSCFGRQSENILTTYELLDLTPLGRQDPPDSQGPDFKRRDQY